MRMKCGQCDRVGTYRLADLAGMYGRHHTVLRSFLAFVARRVTENRLMSS
jgi:hypothetical protein